MTMQFELPGGGSAPMELPRAYSAVSQGLRAGLAAILLALAIAPACGCKPQVSSKPIGTPIGIRSPLGLPPVPIPADNPPTTASIALGRYLFYDTSLSRDNSISCASCHNPQTGFTDLRERSIGVHGTLGSRHAPTVIDAAYSPKFFWDGRAATLEDQVGNPISDSLEMDQSHDALVAKLSNDPLCKTMFLSAFGSEDVTMERVEKAIASFERTLLVGNSAFDQYEYQGRKSALTAAQIRGLQIFRDPVKGNCAACHTIGENDALFTDGQFHNTGEGVGDHEELADLGRYKITGLDSDRGAFKTPSLRNVAARGPYMHDGKLKSLRAVVDFYAGKGNSNPYLDKRISNIQLSGRDRSDLVEFMKSLTGQNPENSGPPGKVEPR